MPLGGVALILAVALLLLIYQQGRLRTAERRVLEVDRAHRRLSAEAGLALKLRDGLLEAIPDAVLVLDEDSHIVFTNNAANALFGHDLLNETLIAATRNYELDTLVLNAQKNDDPESNQRRIDLEQRIIRARVAALGTADEPLYILILHDETELQRLGRARREMVANISHDLKHPITTINLLTETALVNDFDKEKSHETFKKIQHEVTTLAQLVQEMRDLSLIESGQMPVKLTPTDALEMLQISIQPLLSLAESKQQRVVIDVPENLTVLADVGQIKRAISNIVHNAIKFTPKNGQISITASSSADDIKIAIRDDGPGITTENLPRIFERFFQENSARTARTDGTGLGLAIARHIVLAHGGNIWAESAPGQGATFLFTLSRADGQLD